MKFKMIKSEKALPELHIFDDESRESFLKITKKLKKSKNVKCVTKTDGIHFLVWEYLIENVKVEFIHHDDIGNYFSIESNECESAIELIQRMIKEM